MAPALLEPEDAGSTAQLLARSSADRMRVLPCGGRTKLDWHATTARAGAHVSTARLISPLRHYAGDLVATLPAGMRLADANAALSREGQWLPLDPPHGSRATIGGIVAGNASGPRRHKHGTARDLIIGIEVALTDGRVVRAGGRVVKNVAGYDLARLFCGSCGSLGVITTATFKLSPLAAVSTTVVARVNTPARAAELAAAVGAAPVTPSAIEIEGPTPRILVRFESTRRAADQMAAAVRSMLEQAGAATDLVSGDSEQELWRSHEEFIWDRPGSVACVSVLPTQTATVLAELDALSGGLDWSIAGRAALGVLLVRLNGDPPEIVNVLGRLRRAIAPSGHVSLLDGPNDVRESLAAAVQAEANRTLMLAVKQRFDPHGILPTVPGVPEPKA
jgi:glycolate oxidase FAD binding subunit